MTCRINVLYTLTFAARGGSVLRLILQHVCARLEYLLANLLPYTGPVSFRGLHGRTPDRHHLPY